MQFKNKVVLVTGSSRGVGRATALAFAQEGADVIINYLNSEKEAQEVVKQIIGLGRKSIAIRCDVSQEEDVKAMFEQAVQEFGQLDVLVNNTGIVFDVPMFDKTVEQWRKTFEVNVIGTFLCAKYAVPHLRKTKGKIVNISSTSGYCSFSPDSADYDSSKVSVVALTKNLAKQLAPDILVNTVAPGWVNTDMNKDLPADLIEEEVHKIYLKRWAQPEEIAHAVLFFASPENTYVTGAMLRVDGGTD